MITITAVELRKNLGNVIERVANGEEIAVTYRGQTSITLAAKDVKNKPTEKEGQKVLLETLQQAADQRTRHRLKTGNLKEIYWEDMSKKYGLS